MAESRSKVMKIMVINGPNLNMLGIREKNIYGTKDYKDVCKYIKDEGEERGHQIEIFQSNIEGEIINFIQKAYFEKYEGIVINQVRLLTIVMPFMMQLKEWTYQLLKYIYLMYIKEKNLERFQLLHQHA